ncbi:hypothetical protein AAGS40_09405 [Paraburkholderia sp. PREW-6R]|uniref:hypothetical protein n=1 Tax=Paraburkholderia sp. PREW-6R TaxID=3141544 RepID=UPI0031F4A88A
MKMRTLSIACVTAVATLLAACTAVYKNSDACEQLMRSKLAEQSTDTLKISHTGAAIHGSRVVVEGSIDHVMNASEVMAADAAASAASATLVSSARASAAPSTGLTTGSSTLSAATSPAAASAAATASGASAAQAPSAGSASAAVSLLDKSGKPRKSTTAAAAECTFHGSTLDLFSWLAPAKLAAPPDAAASEAAD